MARGWCGDLLPVVQEQQERANFTTHTFSTSGNVLNVSPRQAEAAHDAAEDVRCNPLRQSFRAQLVHLGAICAIVHHDDEDIEPVALDGLELLDVHHQAAVAVEEHDRRPGVAAWR